MPRLANVIRTKSGSGNSLRGLWLTRELPFPPNSGDKIYSGNLAKALADTGTDMTLVGLQPIKDPPVPPDWPIKLDIVPGKSNSRLRSLFSTMPLLVAAYATAEYRSAVATLAKEKWDFVVFDHYALGWALPSFFSERGVKSPVLVHVAHNHEASVWESLNRGYEGSSFIKRVAFWQNLLKIKVFERKVASRVDLLTAITEEDAGKFARDAPGVPIVVLKPGYSGTVSSGRTITAETPRRVILVGSFSWIAKQENLRQFVAIADPIFAEREIEFQIVGSIPAGLATELTRNTTATRITGDVASVEPYLDAARIAVVPEVMGGGFRLKFLDYIFRRVPVATTAHAAAGLPHDILAAMLCCDSLDSLARGIGDLIDRLPELNAMQETAARNARTLFRWRDRGAALLKAIRDCRGDRGERVVDWS